eukprot:UC1_evm1s460
MALAQAASIGHKDLVEVLLEAGAYVDYGYISSDDDLDTTGAALHKASSKGKTPLCHAILNGNVDTVEALILAGANMSKGLIDGQEPLSWAAENRHTEI